VTKAFWTRSANQKRQAVLQEDQGLLLLTPKRKNQQEQNPRAWDAHLPPRILGAAASRTRAPGTP